MFFQKPRGAPGEAPGVAASAAPDAPGRRRSDHRQHEYGGEEGERSEEVRLVPELVLGEEAEHQREGDDEADPAVAGDLVIVPRSAVAGGDQLHLAVSLLPFRLRRSLPRRIHSSALSTARNASCGISTDPTDFMRFLPSFCFSRSLRLREMSPP